MIAEIVTIAPGLAPAAPLMRLLSRFDRAKVEAFAEISIALLDLIDGDADAETEGIEDDFTPILPGVDYGPGCSLSDPAGQMTEDEISAYPVHGDGPGCEVSDPGERDEVKF